MPTSIEKTYADALFTLISDEYGEKSDKLTETLDELKAIAAVFKSTPEAVKLMNTPTVSKTEKLDFLANVFKGRISDYTYNFLRVLADKGRIGHFERIYKQYSASYNELFGITEIAVTTAMPMDEKLRENVKARMEKITGKTVKLNERIDKSLIGGIVIDYGGTRLDGSVKTRLEALKRDIAGTIA